MIQRAIEDDAKKLKKLSSLLKEYQAYLSIRERQPLAGTLIGLVRVWVMDNERELE